MLWEIWSYGKIPYVGMTNHQTAEYVLKGNRMSIPPKCPFEIYELMLRCWRITPTERPTFRDLHDDISEHYDSQEKNRYIFEILILIHLFIPIESILAQHLLRSSSGASFIADEVYVSKLFSFLPRTIFTETQMRENYSNFSQLIKLPKSSFMLITFDAVDQNNNILRKDELVKEYFHLPEFSTVTYYKLNSLFSFSLTSFF